MSRARRAKRKSSQTREFDPSRWAHLIFVIGAFVGSWVLTNLFEDSWHVLFSYWPQVGRPSEMTANLLGIGIALAATIITWRNKRYFQYTVEVVTEVSQVTWPSKAEVRVATVVVIVITLICSLILAGIDTVWSKATDLLYGL